MLTEREFPSRHDMKWVDIKKKLRWWAYLASEAYHAPYRGAVARAKRDQDDLFMLLIFSEMMGVPNPATYYTLELQPIMLERFHEWHTRMGMERSPLDEFRCC